MANLNSSPLPDISAVSRYLGLVGKAQAGQGRQLFLRDAVVEFSSQDSGIRLSARVSDGDDFKTNLEYSEGSWSGRCSCKLGGNCKHCVATLLTMQQVSGDPSDAVTPSPKAVAKSKQVKSPPRDYAPMHPLADRLVDTLGRKLLKSEIAYVTRVQELYHQASTGRNLTLVDLRMLTPAISEYSWAPLELWKDLPKGYYLFWQHLAWEFRRRQIQIPPFMQAITDLGLIEPEMKLWERKKMIKSWHHALHEMAHQSELGHATPVELRLVIFPTEARVQFRESPVGQFTEIKASHAKRLPEDLDAGRIKFDPETYLLWATLRRAWETNWYTLSYRYSDQVRNLGRVVSLPMLAQRVVTPDGAPLARPEELLRIEMSHATSEDEDYDFRLVQADGSPAPKVLAVFPGHPPLYLTETAIYKGPPPNLLGDRPQTSIPAPALETSEGIRFLMQLGMELPPRISARTRNCKSVVTVTCELKPMYPGSDTDAMFIKVESDDSSGQSFRYGFNSWYPASAPQPKPSQAPAAESDELITVVDNSARGHFPSLLDRINARYEGYDSQWRVRVTRNFPEQFLDWLKTIPAEIQVRLDTQLDSLRKEPVSGTVQLDVEESGVDWFDLRVVLNVTDTELTKEELDILLNAKGKFVRLGSKGWRRLQFAVSEEEDEQLARLGLSARDFSAEPQRFHALQLADDAAKKLLPEKQAAEIRRRADELKTRVTPPIPAGIRAEMRPYQVDGFHFLAYLSANTFGGVLADDMGLGKTLQALAWLAWLRENWTPPPPKKEKPKRRKAASTSSEKADPPPASPEVTAAPTPPPSLVVCPKSVMDNWTSEAARFLPGLRVRLWHGEPANELPAARQAADLIVLNYAQLRSLSPEIADYQWMGVILDEAQAIKNPDSQTAQNSRFLKAEHRLALTGTPIENRLLDLWSIFAFAMPGVLGNRAHFLKNFARKDDPFARRRLSARVRPFLLRRTKGQVASDLPDRTEEDIICEMEAEQLTLYRAEFKRAQQLLLNVKTQQQLNEMRFNFLTSLLRLRQICCHPALVSDDMATAESAKLSALEELLEPIIEEGHKVLVFSQFVTMLEILKELTVKKKWRHFYLAGETENRGDLVKEFQETEGAAVFLISLKAGGFGLNLTAASYVILFDPWWNPAVERQAIDRTHRIGQTSKVIAYRLLTKDSIEQKIRHLQQHKAALAEDVLGEERFAQALTLDDLRYLFADEAPSGIAQ